jgi:hypothetical protein
MRKLFTLRQAQGEVLLFDTINYGSAGQKNIRFPTAFWNVAEGVMESSRVKLTASTTLILSLSKDAQTLHPSTSSERGKDF